MLSSGPTLARLLVVLLVAGVHAAGAQDRVRIGATPSPGQIVRVRMTQEMDFEAGTPDAGGRLRFDLTYEDVSQELSVNDTPVPIP